ncbi:MAG: hypothetical protein IPG63_00065 [Xanthomonadales bacterium]|nr:hypothetical protein [Xanthomonadales bacterium]
MLAISLPVTRFYDAEHRRTPHAQRSKFNDRRHARRAGRHHRAALPRGLSLRATASAGSRLAVSALHRSFRRFDIVSLWLRAWDVGATVSHRGLEAAPTFSPNNA